MRVQNAIDPDKVVTLPPCKVVTTIFLQVKYTKHSKMVSPGQLMLLPFRVSQSRNEDKKGLAKHSLYFLPCKVPHLRHLRTPLQISPRLSCSSSRNSCSSNSLCLLPRFQVFVFLQSQWKCVQREETVQTSVFTLDTFAAGEKLQQQWPFPPPALLRVRFPAKPIEAYPLEETVHTFDGMYLFPSFQYSFSCKVNQNTVVRKKDK
jgi:hypothetical protein